MPAYAAAYLDGKPLNLANEKGNVVFLNVWATWCGPCRFETPELQALQNQYAANGLKVIGVSVDEGDAAEVKTFVAEQKITYPIAVDPEGRIATLLQTTVLPTSLLIDRDGKIVWRQIGAVMPNDAKLKAAVEKAVAAKRRQLRRREDAAAAAGRQRSGVHASRRDFAAIGRFAMNDAALALALDEFAEVSGHVPDEQAQRKIGEADGNDDRNGGDEKNDDCGHTWTTEVANSRPHFCALLVNFCGGSRGWQKHRWPTFPIRRRFLRRCGAVARVAARRGCAVAGRGVGERCSESAGCARSARHRAAGLRAAFCDGESWPVLAALRGTAIRAAAMETLRLADLRALLDAFAGARDSRPHHQRNGTRVRRLRRAGAASPRRYRSADRRGGLRCDAAR